MTDNDLNEVVELVADDAEVITVPIDDTLTMSGEAADAAAVGAALALKADLSAVNTIDVNGQAADNQGHIILDATEIPMSSTDTRKVQAVVSGLEGKTGATIPLNSETGAPSIADAIGGQDATAIPMSSTDDTTVAEKIAEIEYTGNANANDITMLKAKTAAQIEMSTTDSTTVKEAIEGRVKTVNGNGPDEDGNAEVTRVAFADNLMSSSSQTTEDTFIDRTSGGEKSVEDGNAWLLDLKGNSVHTGYTPETLTHAETLESGSGITAVAIDRDDWVAEVETSGTYTFLYSSGWTLSSESVDLTDYGITVTGSPVDGDQIVVTYVAEVRGTITMANPQTFCATGWNLYDHSVQRARVLKYSETYGFGVSGSYTALKFAETLDGEQTDVAVSSGKFDIPSDGYIFVTGGNSTNTAIWMTWGDQMTRPNPFEAYKISSISITALMSTYFPYGLMKAGTVVDEIDLNVGYAYQRVERMDYSVENLADAEASGRQYEYDENYIYIAKEAAVSVSITVNGTYTVDDHGMEFYTGTLVPVVTENMYGRNLKNTLERDVVYYSRQYMTSTQKQNARQNIGAAEASSYTTLDALYNTIKDQKDYNASKASGDYPIGIFPFRINASAYTTITIGSITFTKPAYGFMWNSSSSMIGIVMDGDGKVYMIGCGVSPTSWTAVKNNA